MQPATTLATPPPFAAAISKRDMASAAFFAGMSYLALLAYLFLVKLAGIHALPVLVVMTGAMIFLNARLSLAFLLTALFMQNSMIAALTEYGHSFAPAFDIMLGTSFAVTALMAGACLFSWLRSRKKLAAENLGILRWMILFSLVVAAYSVLGLVNSDLKSVAIYDRAYLSGVMFLAIGVVAGSRLSLSFFVNLIRVMAFILIAWGVAEFLFQEQMLESFNVIKFTGMKYLDFRPAVTSMDELMGRGNYLNLSGRFSLDINIPRLRGPNLHSVSYGYELCFCGLVCFMFRSYLLAFLSLAIMVAAGTKGAIILALLSLLLLSFHKITKFRPRALFWAMITLALIYSAGVTVYGVITNDYHILGLIGSLKGFLQNPLGRGVGVGGNMSTLGKESSDFAHFIRYQRQGSTDVALESAIGVMLYQMGISVIVFLVFYGRLWKKIWDAAALSRQNRALVLLPLGLFLILINGIFQEEALSPAGWGLWLLAGGVILGHSWNSRIPVRGEPGASSQAHNTGMNNDA